jgi:ABC-type branched-subunit amino acid transport system substrate-binding protein
MNQIEHNSAIEKKNSLAETSYTITFSPESMARAEIRRLKNIAPFKPSDRIIYESILEYARWTSSRNKMLFLTRDKNDFDFPFIREELAFLNIEIFFSAGDCIKRFMELIQ